MNAKKGLKIALGLILLATLFFIFFGIKGGKEAVDYKVETRADGEFMTMRFFNDDQKEALKFKCKEAYKESNDRTLMKQVEALIFKKGRMNKDIKVFGDDGYVDNNEHDFFVENNARLVSKDFNIVSDSFKLKDRAELRSAPRVEYKTDTLTGLAAKGMEYYLNANTLKFYETSGTYKRNNRLFHYKTSVLWFMEKAQMMILEKDSVIRDQTSLMKSDWITLKFSEDLKHVKETVSQQNSYLYVEDPEKKEIKEVKAENIRNTYNKAGQMTQLTVVKDAEILLKDEFNRTMISAGFVEMNFDGPTGRAQNVLIPHRGKVENTGETKFKVVADIIKVDYDEEGDIRYCEGTGGVRFIVDDYRGGTEKIGYDISNNSMTLDGGETEFVNGDGNTFKAPKFSVDTLNKVLTTNSGVRSVISLKKANVLFSSDPIFINSKNMDHFQWIVALTRIISAVFRKGGDVTFLVDELRSVFDPRGGYFKKGGKYKPSLVAEIGDAIECHMKMIGMIEDKEIDECQREILDAKRREYESIHANGNTSTEDSSSEFPPGSQLCMKCHTRAVISMDGCMTCLNCGDSKCS